MFHSIVIMYFLVGKLRSVASEGEPSREAMLVANSSVVTIVRVTIAALLTQTGGLLNPDEAGTFWRTRHEGGAFDLPTSAVGGCQQHLSDSNHNTVK